MDRLAIISDIHSNVWALEAVLKHAKKRKATKFINLGDMFYGPLAPYKTFEVLQQYEMITVCGNKDRMVYNFKNRGIFRNRLLSYITQDLGRNPMAWLKSLPSSVTLNDEIFICHGAPNDDSVYLLEDILKGSPQVRDETKIKELLQGVNHSVVLCGHSHKPRLVQLRNGQLIVNPGSVGLPAFASEFPIPHKVENHSPFASYALIEKNVEAWKVELVKIPYNYHQAAAKAKKMGYKDWVQNILTGRTF